MNGLAPAVLSSWISALTTLGCCFDSAASDPDSYALASQIVIGKTLKLFSNRSIDIRNRRKIELLTNFLQIAEVGREGHPEWEWEWKREA